MFGNSDPVYDSVDENDEPKKKRGGQNQSDQQAAVMKKNPKHEQMKLDDDPSKLSTPNNPIYPQFVGGNGATPFTTVIIPVGYYPPNTETSKPNKKKPSSSKKPPKESDRSVGLTRVTISSSASEQQMNNDIPFGSDSNMSAKQFPFNYPEYYLNYLNSLTPNQNYQNYQNFQNFQNQPNFNAGHPLNNQFNSYSPQYQQPNTQYNQYSPSNSPLNSQNVFGSPNQGNPNYPTSAQNVFVNPNLPYTLPYNGYNPLIPLNGNVLPQLLPQASPTNIYNNSPPFSKNESDESQEEVSTEKPIPKEN